MANFNYYYPYFLDAFNYFTWAVLIIYYLIKKYEGLQRDHFKYMLTPPVTEALVPLNVQKLPAHVLATQLINQEPGLANVPNQWLDNLDATGLESGV